MAGKLCPNCDRQTLFPTNTGGECSKCGLVMTVDKVRNGTKCSNCGKFTVKDNKCHHCGATYVDGSTKTDVIKIQVDSIETYAKLNYLRDRTTFVDGEPIEDGSWEECREIYIEEAQMDDDIVLTGDEVDAMISRLSAIDNLKEAIRKKLDEELPKLLNKRFFECSVTKDDTDPTGVRVVVTEKKQVIK